MISQILSFGYLPAVVLTGYWVVSNPLNTSTSQLSCASKIGVSVTIGMMLWFPLLFTTAWLNAFIPSWIGISGWIASLFLALHLKGELRVDAVRLSSKEPIGLIAFAVAIFVFNGIFTSESIMGGRDQGLYSTYGAHIAKTGMLRSELPYERLYESVNYQIAGSSNPGGFFYDLPNGDMYMQFPPTLSLHLAQFFGIGDYEGLLLFNPLIASITVLLFFGLARLFLDRNWTFLATGLFALNASQVWNTRITLSEVIAQNLILGGLGLAIAAFRTRHRLGYAIACIIASSAAFTRVDGFLIPLSITMANLALSCYSDDSSKRADILIAGSCGALASSIIAYLYNYQTSTGYFLEFAFEINSILAIALTGLVLHVSIERSSKLKQTVSFIVQSPRLLNRLAVIFVLLSIYGYFIRPYIEPFSQFENPHYGTRNYRENSLLDLSKYISIPTLIFALFGTCTAALGLSKKRNIEILILLIPWLVFSILYLYDPRISADHIWRIRRFTPIVIPGFIFFAVWGASYFANKHFNDKVKKYFYFLSLAWSCIFLYKSLQPIAFLKQYEGTVDTIRAISSTIPEGALTLANVSSEILGPLQLAEGHKMIRDQRDAVNLTPVVLSIIEQEFELGREVFILSETPHEERISLVPIGNWKHYIPRLERTPIAPAINVHIQKRNLHLSQIIRSIQKIAPDQSYFSFGGTKVFNVEETGLYGQEFNGELPFRWTNGRAVFTIKHSISRNPLMLNLKTHAVHPDGSSITVSINGTPVFKGSLSHENLELSCSLEGIDFLENNNEIQIESNQWTPSETIGQSTDSRELGIAIEEVVLMFDESIRIGNSRFGNTPVKGIEETGLYPKENIDNQILRWTNGNAKFSFSLANDYVPNRIEFDIAGGIQQDRVLVVKWNDQIIHQGPLNPILDTLSIPLESFLSDDPEVLLELICDPLVPSDLGLNNDSRPLGLRIAEIRLKSDP